MEKRIEKLEKEIEKTKNDFNKHIETHVIEDLLVKVKVFNGECYKYSYSAIAHKWNVQFDKVVEIAKNNKLER